MSRIRTIKPEFWTSEQVMECSTNARLLFIGLWNFCDDAGRHPLSPKRVKAEIFPADDFTADDVRRMIDELEQVGLLITYVVDGIEYLSVTGWHHQKIDRPQGPKYPGPDNAHSSNARRALATEGKGREGKGKGTVASQQLSSTPPEPGTEPPRKAELDRIEHALRTAAGLENDPSTGLFDLSPILTLKAKGYDLERDILPVLSASKAAGKRGRTWRYYLPAIEAAKAGNDAIRPANGGDPPAPPNWDARAEYYLKTGRWRDEWGDRGDLPDELARRLDAIDKQREEADRRRNAEARANTDEATA